MILVDGERCERGPRRAAMQGKERTSSNARGGFP